MTIWVCGEVLIDIFGDQHIVGGGPANTARALALLGQDVEFIGGISTDSHGDSVRSVLAEAGVGIHHCLTGERPTCTAAVSFDESGSASYVFTIDGTVTFDFDSPWLPDPSVFKPAALHIGSLATLVEPGASRLFEWAKRVAFVAPIVFDPNVRPLVVSDKLVYRARVERWLDISTVVKVSDDDLLWLYPDETPEQVGARWIVAGVPLVVITRGAAGITAITALETVSVSGVEVDVVDTIGAGDTVGAIVIEALIENGVADLQGDRLLEMLHCACLAAAITCSRAGARPPTKSELDAALEMSN
ncbi:MAG: carbohydrate kinase [Actinobacteria bacterium]|nr:carbohydrate kinase [Actinomycetota bacterium]